MKYRLALLTVVLLLIAVFGGSGTAQPATPRFSLYVSMFSFIPDAAGDQFRLLRLRIKKEFEAKNPSVELRLKELDSSDDPYTVKSDDSHRIGSWLTTPISDDPSKSGLHLVEADMVVLAELVRQNLIRPWDPVPDTGDWHPAAEAAVRIDGKTYGMPHWLCGDFIFSRREDVTKARNAAELRAALDRGTTRAHLAGRITGSWNFASLYLDAYADTYGAEHVLDGVKADLDDRALAGLKTVAQACTKDAANPCLTSEYSHQTAAPYLFADHQADAVLGYSERLHYILRRAGNRERVYFASAPLGDGNHPLLFVDAFVLRRDCTGDCEKSARAFTDYMARPETMNWILMSEDAGATGVPRYLLPATKSAYRVSAVQKDRYYPQMERMIRDALPYPNTKFYDLRATIREKLEAQVKP